MMVIALALTIVWVFAIGAWFVETGLPSELPLRDLAVLATALLMPLVVLWLITIVLLQRHSLHQQLQAHDRTHQHLSQQLEALLDIARQEIDRESQAESPAKAGIEHDHHEDEPDAQESATVSEDENVPPEFVQRAVNVVDQWVEVEFRNVGGPARGVEAITDTDSDTRVTSRDVGSWKSVTVSMQSIAEPASPFRFCLSFEDARGLEQQQFFLFDGQSIEKIVRPSN